MIEVDQDVRLALVEGVKQVFLNMDLERVIKEAVKEVVQGLVKDIEMRDE